MCNGRRGREWHIQRVVVIWSWRSSDASIALATSNLASGHQLLFQSTLCLTNPGPAECAKRLNPATEPSGRR